MDIKTDFMPKHGDRIYYRLDGAKGRRWFQFIICPNCNWGRWIAEKTINRPGFTGRCKKCQDAHIKEILPKGPDASNWQGGRIKRRGYVWVRIEEIDPFFFMAGVKKRKGRSWGYIMEHRLIMARHLGRPLESWEMAHHINGISDDNRIENLKLVTSNKEHSMAPFIELQSLRTRVTQLEAEVVLLGAQLEKDGIQY